MKLKQWGENDRINGCTLDEHVRGLFVKLRLSPKQRKLLGDELRDALGWIPSVDVVDLGDPAVTKSAERVLRLAEEFKLDRRQTNYLGMPTRTNALRKVLRANGDAWLAVGPLFQAALKDSPKGTTRQDLNGSFRSMLLTGEVEHDNAPRGRRKYRLARGEGR